MLSLESLKISGWVNFKKFPECFFRFLHLARLNIRSCPGLESFPEHGLLPNLRGLQICHCENLKFLPNQMESFTSLEHLDIEGFWLQAKCPEVVRFPGCLKERGEYWQWIAPIPYGEIYDRSIHEL